MNVGGLTYTVSDKNISITSMVPKTDILGILIYDKELTITNTSTLNGKVDLNLVRTSGAPLNSLRYGLYENDVLIDIDDVPSDGLIYLNSLLGNETKTIKVALWLKSDYSGSETTFVGTLEPTITLDTITAASYISSLSNLTNNYVKFNCNGSTCETWRIKEVSNGRLVLTTDAYLSSTFTDSGLFTTPSGLNDETLVVSMSTDNHAVYLKKTTKVVGGNGTSASPYELASDIDSSYDHKVIGYITYMGVSSEVSPKQPIYYNEINRVSKKSKNIYYSGWSSSGGTDHYNLGSIINSTSNITLYLSLMSDSQRKVDLFVRFTRANSLVDIYGTNTFLEISLYQIATGNPGDWQINNDLSNISGINNLANSNNMYSNDYLTGEIGYAIDHGVGATTFYRNQGSYSYQFDFDNMDQGIYLFKITQGPSSLNVYPGLISLPSVVDEETFLVNYDIEMALAWDYIQPGPTITPTPTPPAKPTATPPSTAIPPTATPFAPTICSDIDNQTTCNNTNGCIWKNGECDDDAPPTPTPFIPTPTATPRRTPPG